MRTIGNSVLFQCQEKKDVQNGTTAPSVLAERDQKGAARGHPAISVIIPNRNGSATIGPCLEAALKAVSDRDEIIVVDDGSTDGSDGIVRRYPCSLIILDRHAGASRARNVGALRARNEVLVFTDADCLLQADTLDRVRQALAVAGPGVAVGGTYTLEPADRDFFSRFQSIFINHAETRQARDPDYIASHAMALYRSTFLRSGGFPEDFLPIIEDVELSHRLRRNGCRLVMQPRVQVRHIFRFSLLRSLRNAVRKARYWTRYSLGNGDLLADSGTASRGLKFSVLAWAASAAAAAGSLTAAAPVALAVIPLFVSMNVAINRELLRAFWKACGAWFGIRAAAYYLLVYPAAVGTGAALGLGEHWSGKIGRPHAPLATEPPAGAGLPGDPMS